MRGVKGKNATHAAHLSDIAKVESGVRQEGRRMVLLLSKK